MKKPDAKRRRPGLQRGFESLTQEDDTARVAQVIKRLTGRREPLPTPPEVPSPPSPPSPAPSVEEPLRPKRGRVKTTTVEDTPVKITPVTIEAYYYKVPNDVSDVLASLQTPAEQAVYHRLFRLSYGYNQKICRVGMQALSKATNIASKKTIAKAIAGLIRKGYIAIVQEAHNDVRGTWYRVFLPDEIEEVRKRTGSKITAVKSTAVKSSAVDFAGGEEKSSAVEKTSVLQLAENPEGEPGGVKNTAVNFTPNTTSSLQTLSLPALVDQFYQSLHQKPSKRKRERGIREGERLLKEGFALEDLHYTISWVIQKHPDTGSFDRIPFFIDQALKERQAEQRALEIERRQQREAERRRAEQQRVEEEQRKIMEVRATLSAQQLEELKQEAVRILKEEKANLEFGQEALIRLKVDELLKKRYLASS